MIYVVVTDDECADVEAAFTKKRDAEVFLHALGASEECGSKSWRIHECPLDAPHTIPPVLGFRVHALDGQDLSPSSPSVVVLGREKDAVQIGTGGTMKGKVWAYASAATEAGARAKAEQLIRSKRAENKAHAGKKAKADN